MSLSVFNKDNKSHLEAETPLHFGERLGIHDTINVRHQYIEDLFQYLKSIDWNEKEVDLTRDKQQFESCPTAIRDIMIKNLSYQSELDSVASRSAGVLIAPFITNSELWRCLVRIADNEVLHSATYTQIIRMCLQEPQEFFDEVYKNQAVLDRASKVIEVFDEIAKQSAEYTLTGVVTEKMKEAVVKYWVAMYCLERLEFMVSFSATFALAEQDYFLGIATLVQKIMIDEFSVHKNLDKYVIKIVKSELKETFDKLKLEILQIVEDVRKSEYDWAEYLFSEGRSVVGLNEQLSKKFVDFCSQDLYDDLGFELPFERIEETPLPYMNKWLNIDGIQIANQETQNSNYMLNSWFDDTNEDFDFSVN